MALIRAVPFKELGVLGYDCSWPVQWRRGGHDSKVKRKEERGERKSCGGESKSPCGGLTTH